MVRLISVDSMARPGRPRRAGIPVEIGLADHGRVGAQRNRGDDVRAAHDAGVDVDLGAVADPFGHVRQQSKRDGCAVELAAAVVGQHDEQHIVGFYRHMTDQLPPAIPPA